MNRGHIEQTDSPDHSVNTGNNSPVLLNRLTLPKDPRALVSLILGLAVCLALSIAVNIWSAYTIRDIGTRKWLHDYDLNQFQMHEFRDVQIDVQVAKAMAQQAMTQCKR